MILFYFRWAYESRVLVPSPGYDRRFYVQKKAHGNVYHRRMLSINSNISI